MIEEMQANGVPIDGVGIQYHVGPGSLWNWNEPITRETTANVIKRFGDLGLQVHITEIDVVLCESEPCEYTQENLEI